MLLPAAARTATLDVMTDRRAASRHTSFLFGVCSAFPWPTMLQQASITVRWAAGGLAHRTVSLQCCCQIG